MKKKQKKRLKSSGIGKEISNAKKILNKRIVIRKPKYKSTGVGKAIIDAIKSKRDEQEKP